jgi:hypothetical protein
MGPEDFMVRALGLSVLMAAAQAAQIPADLCDPQHSSRERHCEVREESLTGQKALDIDPGQNGGVHVRGSSRQDVRLRVKVEGHAGTATRARELAAAVRLTTTGGRLRSDGPMTTGPDHWATSFYLDVPANMELAINTNNGGISLETFRGNAVLRANNGGIRVLDAAGDIKGHTQNGGLRIELAGARWDGPGLDLETRNGSVRLMVPANYSAELETGTVHGRVAIDFPATIYPGRQRRFTATLGTGGSRVRAMTTNGSVTVLRQ